jgi:hypothetical protein
MYTAPPSGDEADEERKDVSKPGETPEQELAARAGDGESPAPEPVTGTDANRTGTVTSDD